MSIQTIGRPGGITKKSLLSKIIEPGSALFYWKSENSMNVDLINQNSVSCPLNRPIGTRFNFYLSSYYLLDKNEGNGTYQPRCVVYGNRPADGWKARFVDVPPAKNWVDVSCGDDTPPYIIQGGEFSFKGGEVVSGSSGSLRFQLFSDHIDSSGTVFQCESVEKSSGYIAVLNSTSTSIRDIGSAIDIKFIGHF